jgi:NAD(P)-dependent dehydrogenase (short-subunit alcohol dehydrogenase family)
MLGDMTELFDLSGKVAIVTGGGMGLGQAMAEGLAQYGATVAVVDINLDAATEVASLIEGAGGKAMAVRCDVSDQGQVADAVEAVLAAWGKIDILIANAGIGIRALAEEMTIDQWHRVLQVNLDGVWFFDQLVGKHMIERGEGGSIVNMASIAALVGVTTGNANYAASKGAIAAMTRCLAVEWAEHNIRVNSVAPTHFRTPLIAKLIEDQPEVKTYFLGNIPLGRLGEVEDIVGPAVFLASDAASMVTGHCLAVDGGHTAK